MPWTCPNCKRSFRNANQWHSCLLVPIDEHFMGKPQSLREAFDMIHKLAISMGPVRVSVVRNAILYSGFSTFMAVKPRKDHLDIEMLLENPHEGFPVLRIIQASRKRFAHFLVIEHPEDVDSYVKSLMYKSYTLVSNA